MQNGRYCVVQRVNRRGVQESETDLLARDHLTESIPAVLAGLRLAQMARLMTGIFSHPCPVWAFPRVATHLACLDGYGSSLHDQDESRDRVADRLVLL